MESKKCSISTVGGDALENLVIEDSFNSEEEECGKVKSKSPSYDKPSVQIKNQAVSSERIWSEDEEITILNIAINFSSQKGLDPAIHRTDFFVFLKESQQLDGEFTKHEVATKLKFMKKKFKSYSLKGKTISGPHENNIFELCEKIWGGEGPHVSLLSAEEILTISERHVGLGENIVKEAMEYIGESTRVEFMQQWKEIQALELEMIKNRAALVEYQIKIMLEANKLLKK